MNEADALDLMQLAVWTVIVASGPCVAAAMAIGLVISFLQALTQIQEATLTFVPKIMAVFFAAMASAYFMGAAITTLATASFGRIETGF